MYVSLELSPHDVGFSHPLSEELVTLASGYIRDDLNSILRSHDDSKTRQYDKRRTHTPLSRSTWLIKFGKNKVLITNQIADESSQQFRALYYGNGDGLICAKHGMTRQRLKPWGDNWIESKGRYSGHDGHKNKPKLGDLGAERPGVLKYYDKHSGMWMYRQCVSHISSAVITDMNRQVRDAVRDGLEKAYNDQYGDHDKDTLGANEPDTPSMYEPVTWEEMHYKYQSKTKVDTDTEEYLEQQRANIQQEMDDRLSNAKDQERARSELQKVGLAPNTQPKGTIDVKPPVIDSDAIVSDTHGDRLHRLMNVVTSVGRGLKGIFGRR